MSTETLLTILAGIAVTGVTVWAVETLAVQRDARARDLAALDQTLQMMVASLGDVTAFVAGPEAARAGRFDMDAFPRAEHRLVGDIDALRLWFGILAEFHGREAGSGITRSDAERAATATHRVRAAIREQEERVLGGNSLRALTPTELNELRALMLSVTDVIGGTAESG